MTIRLYRKRTQVVENEIDKLVVEVADTRTAMRCRPVDTRLEGPRDPQGRRA